MAPCEVCHNHDDRSFEVGLASERHVFCCASCAAASGVSCACDRVEA